MLIDIIFVVIIIIAIFKGLSRGLIIALFSFAAVIIGVASAIKFSVYASVWLKNSFKISPQWLPVLSFTLVMICVILLVRIVAKFLETIINFAMLEWLNKLGGAILFLILYIGVYSILLFYLNKMGIINNDKITNSLIYKYIEPLGPKFIDLIGSFIPFFKNMFSQLDDYFNTI